MQKTEAPTCPACGTVLVALDELLAEELDRSVVLTWCESLFEAMVLRTALGEEGINCVVEDEGLLEMVNPYHGGGTNAQGGTRVLVRLGDAEAALELLRRKDAGELAISEEDVPEEDAESEEAAPSP